MRAYIKVGVVVFAAVAACRSSHDRYGGYIERQKVDRMSMSTGGKVGQLLQASLEWRTQKNRVTWGISTYLPELWLYAHRGSNYIGKKHV